MVQLGTKGSWSIEAHAHTDTEVHRYTSTHGLVNRICYVAMAWTAEQKCAVRKKLRASRKAADKVKPRFGCKHIQWCIFTLWFLSNLQCSEARDVIGRHGCNRFLKRTLRTFLDSNCIMIKEDTWSSELYRLGAKLFVRAQCAARLYNLL